MKQLFFLFVISPLFSQNILSLRERADLIEKSKNNVFKTYGGEDLDLWFDNT